MNLYYYFLPTYLQDRAYFANSLGVAGEVECAAEENTDDILPDSLWFMFCGLGWNDLFSYLWKQEFFCFFEGSQ